MSTKKLSPNRLKPINRFQTQWNPNANDKGEVNLKPSKTVPDDAMSIDEIYRRYAQGLPINGSRVPMYHGESLLPDLKKMDLEEIRELSESIQERIVELRKEIDKKKEAAEMDAVRQKHIDEYLAEQKASMLDKNVITDIQTIPDEKNKK